MNQAEYQEDPSMEEILASIRRIITEEKTTPSFVEPAASEPTTSFAGRQGLFPPKRQDLTNRQISLSEEEELPDPAPFLNHRRPPVAPSSVRLLREEPPVVASKPSPGEKPDQPKTQALEDLFLEALKPLVRDWLEEHMPSLVKQLAAQHVEEILYKKVFR